MNDVLEISFQVNCSQEHAFRTWTERAGSWWPMDHTPSGNHQSTLTYEAKDGGLIFEQTPENEQNIMGTILDWDPFARIRHTWHMGAPKGKQTEVQIQFSQELEGITTVSIEQRGWEAFGESADQARRGNHRGWGALITFYIPAAEQPQTQGTSHD